MKHTIVLECDNDELLIRLLGVPRKSILHGGGRDEVVKSILKNSPGACIGLVDEDPGTMRSPQRKAFKIGRPNFDLHVESMDSRKLVVLHPYLEGWLIKAVHACKGRMANLDKGLSDDPRELHSMLSPRGDERMKKILDFLQQKDSPHLRKLRAELGIPQKPASRSTTRNKR